MKNTFLIGHTINKGDKYNQNCLFTECSMIYPFPYHLIFEKCFIDIIDLTIIAHCLYDPADIELYKKIMIGHIHNHCFQEFAETLTKEDLQRIEQSLRNRNNYIIDPDNDIEDYFGFKSDNIIIPANVEFCQDCGSELFYGFVDGWDAIFCNDCIDLKLICEKNLWVSEDMKSWTSQMTLNNIKG